MTKSVLIVGGGIGGVTAALALRRAGARVTLVEREGAFSPVGAGIVLAPNAIAILRRLGVDTSSGERVRSMALRTADHALLQKVDLDPLSETLGPAFAFHRGELHRALLEAMPADVEVRCGTALVSLADQGEVVVARMAEGADEAYDLVVGADGIQSQVRHHLGGGPELRYSGYTCWRAVCANPGVSESVEMWGRGARAGMVPLSGGRLYVFLVVSAPRRAPALAWPEGFLAVFGGFGGPCPAVLRALDGVPLLHHDLEELDEPAWGRGRIWLLGDAAHAMTPNLGQGAAMAIEDALVVGACLGDEPAVGHARYVGARHARVRKIQLDARRLGQVAHWRNRPAIWLRNALLRLAPRSVGDRQYLGVVEPGLALARAS